MRSLLGHCGTCDRCGAFAFPWVDVPRVLDYGVPDMPPVETEMVRATAFGRPVLAAAVEAYLDGGRTR